MKKLLPVVLIAAAFALIGCAHKAAPTPTTPDTSVTQVKAKHHRHHHHGKLGVEKTTQDVAK